jgi:hypothetical protein
MYQREVGQKMARVEKSDHQKYPPNGAGYGLTRLFWFAPVMFLLGLVIRQGSFLQWLIPQNQESGIVMAQALLANPTDAAFGGIAISTPTAAPQPSSTPASVTRSAQVQARPTTNEAVLAHLSFYWPPLGDMNCDYECAHIANGDRWQKWVGIGVACPIRYPLGTVFVIMGSEWKCVDRGEAIVVNPDGSIWLDMLLPQMPKGIAWGTIQLVEVHRK